MFQLPLLSLFGSRPAAPSAPRPDRRQPYALEAAGLQATVTRKPMRSLRLRLAPPDGRLLVSAPLRCSDKAIREFLAERRDWIVEHQQRMARAAAKAAPPLQYADGETLPVLGQALILRVLAQGQRARARRLDNGDLLLTAPADASLTTRRKAVERWLAQALLEAAEGLRPGREAALGVKAAGLKVRAMRSRWGNCNTRSGVITLSLALAERPLESLDYILVHELAHLIVRSHGPRFKAIVERHVPDWKRRRKALNGTDATE
jgi:hypothetical protein